MNTEPRTGNVPAPLDDASQAAEGAPNQHERANAPEYNEPGDIAVDFVNEFAPADLTDRQKTALARLAAQEVRSIVAATDISQDEMQERYAQLIRDIQGFTINETPAEVPAAEQGQAEHASEEQEEEAEYEDEEESEVVVGLRGRIMNKLGLVQGAGVWGNSMLALSRWNGRKAEKRAALEEKIDNMTDEEYEKYLRWNKVKTAVGVVAIGGAFLATKGHLWDFPSFGGGDRGATPAPVSDPEGPQTVSNEIHNNLTGMNPQEILELGANSRHDQAQWLLENGRVNNDFNNIDVSLTKDETINKLAIQYNRSPNELAAQMYQIQEVEAGNKDALAQIPEDYRIREGETMEQYSARVGEFLHADGETKDKFAHLTTEYVRTHYNVQDMPSHYQSAYIDADGTVHWDTEVTKADPNDKIIMLSKDTGIRLPCGQPVKILPEEAPAPVQQYEQSSQPVQHNYVPPQGTGGETPVTPGTPETPVTPETPTVPVTPEVPTEPETPVVPPSKPEKDTSLTPDLPGLTADTSETEQTQHPDTAGNGTGSPDATTTTETTPNTTQDTGADVTVPGAGTETNAGTGNQVETGANAPDGNGGTTPNGTIDPNNV